MTVVHNAIVQQLSAAAIAYAFGWFSRSAWRLVSQVRPAQSVWRLSRGQEICFVTASYKGSSRAQPTSVEIPYDYAGMTELYAELTALYRGGQLSHCEADAFDWNRAQRNLVVLGGPKRNRVARTLLAKFESPIEFVDVDLLVKPADRRYSTSASGEVKQDFCLVLAGPNPYAPDKRVFVIAGCRSFGTLAGSRALLRPTISKLRGPRGWKRQFAMVVKCDVEGEVVLPPLIQEGPIPFGSP
jgi:hypothetical protein